MPIGPIQKLSESSEKRLLNINLFGTLNGIHAVLPTMLERNTGQIVNVASLIARIPTPFASVYTGSKFAVYGMTEALRHELPSSL